MSRIIVACSPNSPNPHVDRIIGAEIEKAHVACKELVIVFSNERSKDAHPNARELELKRRLEHSRAMGFPVKIEEFDTAKGAIESLPRKCLAFWDGFDEMTIEIVRRATQRRIPTEIYPA